MIFFYHEKLNCRDIVNYISINNEYRAIAKIGELEQRIIEIIQITYLYFTNEQVEFKIENMHHSPKQYI